MNDMYLKQWSVLTRHWQKPLDNILNLNLKTLKKLKFVKGTELMSAPSPEEIWIKNFNYSIENGHEILNYIEECYKIFNQYLEPINDSLKELTESNVANLKTFNPLTLLSVSGHFGFTKPLFETSLSSTDPLEATNEVSTSTVDQIEETMQLPNIRKPKRKKKIS